MACRFETCASDSSTPAGHEENARGHSADREGQHHVRGERDVWHRWNGLGQSWEVSKPIETLPQRWFLMCKLTITCMQRLC